MLHIMLYMLLTMLLAMLLATLCKTMYSKPHTCGADIAYVYADPIANSTIREKHYFKHKGLYYGICIKVSILKKLEF